MKRSSLFGRSALAGHFARLAAIALTLGGASEAFCALTWETQEVVTDATPFDKEVLAKFPFKNTGDKPVKIKGLRAVCGCTTATLAKTEFAPGESGEIVAKFEIGARMGEKRNPITVELEDPAEPKVALYFVVKIPEVVKMPISFVKWKVGEPREAKSLTAFANEQYPLKDLIVHTGTKELEVKVDRVNDNEFRIHMKPKFEKETLVAALQLEAVLETGQRKRAFAYVSVR